MAEGIATRSSRGHRTICVPIEEEDYLRIIHDPRRCAPLMIVSVRPRAVPGELRRSDTN